MKKTVIVSTLKQFLNTPPRYEVRTPENKFRLAIKTQVKYIFLKKNVSEHKGLHYMVSIVI